MDSQPGVKPGLKKDWVVSQASFDRLLLALDPDREAAGERYLQIRDKLCKFFQWRNCATPDEFADQTIDRVARRIEEGSEILTGNVYLFFHGVAVNVLREYWKREEKVKTKPLDEVPEVHTAVENPMEVQEIESEREHRLGCLDGCVKKLPPQQLRLITEYHKGEGGAKIAKRTQLAEDLGIPLNALRIRAFRIRGDLESCITECTQRLAG
jgi:DNA-directed RNA polymerase specialized sigma24 family protein